MTNCLPDSNKKSECFVSRQLTKHSLYIIMYRTVNDVLNRLCTEQIYLTIFLPLTM